MPRIQIDFAQVPDNNLPDGNYDATISDVELRQSEGSQFPYLNWEFTVSGGDYHGRKVFMTTSLNPKAWWNLKYQFTQMGIDASANMTLDVDEASNKLIEPPIIGRPVEITIINEEYNGRSIPKVSEIVKAYDQTTSAPEGKKRSLL